MLQPFDELGKTVLQVWEKSDYSDDLFPAISGSLIEESRILQRVNAAEIVDWLMKSDGVPAQDLYEFGQPPVVVFNHEKFSIQVLFWLDSTTCIHEHSFSGAFGVLAGSSVHSRYVFEPEKPEFEKLRLGKTKFLHSELLRQGDTRSIQPGNGFAHALFHLEWPSISVVVRSSQWEQKNTPHPEQTAPQYNYIKPYLAIDPFYNPALPMTQLRMIESLYLIDRRLFWANAKLLAAECEPFTLFKLVCVAHGHLGDGAEWLELVDHASARDAHMVACFVRCAEEMLRERKLLSLRKAVLDPTHRFLLGLLLNVPDRMVLYRLIAERFPGCDPESLVLRWLGEIFDDKSKGLKLTPVSMRLLQLALHHDDFDHAKAGLAEGFGQDRVLDGATGGMRRLWDKIRGLDILAPLFEKGAGPGSGWKEAA